MPERFRRYAGSVCARPPVPLCGALEDAQCPNRLGGARSVAPQDFAVFLQPVARHRMVRGHAEMLAGVAEVDDLRLEREALEESPVVRVVEGGRTAGGFAPACFAMAALARPQRQYDAVERETDAVTVSAATSPAARMRASVSGAMLSQRSCMLWVSRCSVLTDGVTPPIFAMNSSPSRGVQWPHHHQSELRSQPRQVVLDEA